MIQMWCCIFLCYSWIFIFYYVAADAAVLLYVVKVEEPLDALLLGAAHYGRQRDDEVLEVDLGLAVAANVAHYRRVEMLGEYGAVARYEYVRVDAAEHSLV